MVKLNLRSFLLCVLLFCFGLVDSYDLSAGTKPTKCKAFVASKTNLACHDYRDLYPYRDKYKCSLNFTPPSKEYFTYMVLKYKYRFVNLRIQMCNLESAVNYTRCVIQPLEWVWTFGGFEGGEQYLDWPAEYETLSLGMLKKFTSKPLRLNVTMHDTCDIAVGQENTTERFALAFADLIHDLGMKNDKYNYSYWCYKSRIFIESFLLYKLCKEVICPLETIGYKCCKQFYDVNTHEMTIQCLEEPFKFGSVWWICPFVIGVILYLYFAMMLAWVLSFIYKHLDSTGQDNVFMDIKTFDKESYTKDERTPLLRNPEEHELKCHWINHNSVTVLSIIATPFRRCCSIHPVTTSRCIRCLLAVSTLSVIFIKVMVHYAYHKDLTIASVNQGAPKDFLSMIAGYEPSRSNFLGFLGGPYTALAGYICSILIFMAFPRDYASFIEMGLPANNCNPISALFLDLRLRERFGVKRILCTQQSGYAKLYNTMLANIFSLLNPGFWGFTFYLQIDRFKHFIRRFDRGILSGIIILFVAFFYLTICVIEFCCTIVLFGFPTLFGITVVFKAYILHTYTWLKEKGAVGVCLLVLVFPSIVSMLLLTTYMFSIIFVDSFIFIAKVAIFTYTGLFVNPSYTEGHVIFGITIIMYIYESIHSINDTYERLFNQTKKVCKRKGEQLKIAKHLHRKEIEGAAIPCDLYKYVIRMYKPIRVEVFISIVKISVIVFFLYISLSILVNFDGFQELSIVTQTATTIFVSFVPKIVKKMFSLNERRTILRIRRKVNEVVDSYLVYKGIDLGEHGIQNQTMNDDSLALYDSI